MSAKNILITGASAGIGKVFAERFAQKKFHLILVARRLDRLAVIKTNLEQKYQTEVDIIAMDLAQENSAEKLYSELEKRKLNVYGIVNNAGFGWVGNFSQQKIDNITEMIHIHITTPTKICKLLLPKMLADNQGMIITVSSIGGFQPVPYFSVYSSVKSYLLNFSLSLAKELKESDIRVFCLCPGTTKTEFQEVAGVDESLPHPGNWKTADAVVDYAFKKLKSKQLIGIPGIKNKIMIFFNRFVTRNFAAEVGRKLYKQEF